MEAQVNQFLTYLVEEKQRSSHTSAAYRNDLIQFTRFVQERTISHEHVVDDAAEIVVGQHPQEAGSDHSTAAPTWQDVDLPVIVEYLDSLNRREEYSTATVARKIAALRSFLQYLTDQGTITSNPASQVEPPKVNKRSPRSLRPHEIELLLAAPAREQTPYALRDKALLETLYAAGARVTEVVVMNVADVDLTARRIRCGVATRSREVVLYPALVDALQNYLAEGRVHLLANTSEQALFLNHRGQRLTRQGLWLIIRRYARQVGITAEVTPLTLRHSFAAHQLHAGVNPHVLQEQLGYASIASTQAHRKSAGAFTPHLIIDGKVVDE